MNDNLLNEPRFDGDNEQEVLNHSDILVGLFTEPSATFEKMSYLPTKVIDWLIPTILVIIVAIFSNYIIFSDPQIKYSMIEKQMEKITKNFDEMVAKGNLTQDVANEQLDKIRDNMDKNVGGFSVMQIVGTTIVVFLKLFIVAGVFLILFKLILRGNGDYKQSLVAFGLPAYITVIQIIIMVIVALAMKKMFSGLSIADFMDIDKGTYKGYLLSYFDPFAIWFYAIVSIAYAKLFKVSVVKSYIAIFGTWIIFTLFIFVLAQFIPFLKFFGIGA